MPRLRIVDTSLGQDTPSDRKPGRRATRHDCVGDDPGLVFTPGRCHAVTGSEASVFSSTRFAYADPRRRPRQNAGRRPETRDPRRPVRKTRPRPSPTALGSGVERGTEP